MGIPSPLVFRMLVMVVAGWLRQNDALVVAYLREENRVLREQLGDQRLRFPDEQRRRLAVRAHAMGRALLGQVATLVTPDTLLRWYRELVAKKYDGSKKQAKGRLVTKVDVAQLVVRMATENPTWGYTRLRGALDQLGHEVGRGTIQRILRDAGLEPAPERGKRGSWAAFLKAHAGQVAAMDFFSVEVVTARGLVRYCALVVIDITTRRVEIAGICHDPYQDWVSNALRALLDPVDGFLKHARFLIHDRDPLFGAAVSRLLKGAAVKPVRLPSKSPNLNAFAERFVGSIRRECLNRVIPLGERHLRELVREYVTHYHQERPHQGLGNGLIAAETLPAANDDGRSGAVGVVRRRERLGGLLSYYHRDAA
jgi:putative transposase